MYNVQITLAETRIPKHKPYEIPLRAYDMCPLAPIGLYQGVPVQLARKTMLIDMRVLDAQLDYNILLVQSYM